VSYVLRDRVSGCSERRSEHRLPPPCPMESRDLREAAQMESSKSRSPSPPNPLFWRGLDDDIRQDNFGISRR